MQDSGVKLQNIAPPTLFSDPDCLPSLLKIKQSEIDNILKEFGDPEKIDNSPITAPSKRIEDLFPRYKKQAPVLLLLEILALIE